MAEAGFEGEMSKEGLAQKIIVRAKTRLEEDHSRGYNSHSTWQPDAVIEERIDPRTHRPFLHFWTRGDDWDWKPEEVMIGILSGGVYSESASREHGEVFIRHGDSQREYSVEKLYIKFDDSATLFRRCGKTLGLDEAELSKMVGKFSREAIARPQKQYLFQKIAPFFGVDAAVDFSTEPAESSTRTKSVEELQREVDLYKSELHSARERAERKDREIERLKVEVASGVRMIGTLNRDIADLRSRTVRGEQGGQTEYERSLRLIGLSDGELRSLNEEEKKQLLAGFNRGFHAGLPPDKFANNPKLKAITTRAVQDFSQALGIVAAYNKVKIK